MSIQQFFSLFCCLVAAVGIFGALKVPLVRGMLPGPGFLPLVYSIGLLIAGALLFFTDKSKKKINIRASLLTGAGRKAFIFFLLNWFLIVLVYAFGISVAMLVFTFLACFALKRQTPLSVVLFSIINTVVFYIIFVVLFQLPFERGIIFRMLGWYI